MNGIEQGVLIWLRSTGDIELDEFTLEDNLQKFVDVIRIFDNVDECIENLLSIKEEKVFLRLGCGLSFLVDILNDFNQVQCIYLSEPFEYKGNIKIRGVFTDNIQLFDQLQKDMNAWKNRHIYLTFCDVDSRRMETTTQDVQHHAAQFMWSQMLLETLLQMPSSTNNPHKDLLVEARRLYSNNQSVLVVINEFEGEYQAEDAIKWYTRDSFLYRLVNKALRTRDIFLIFKFRFLIQHIYKQLKDEQQKTLSNLRLPMTLYRGQFITKDEFDQLQRSINHLISVNTFLSTTTDRQIANLFSGEGSSPPDLISVVFEILIDSTCDVIYLPPFADISNLSYMKDENEILLSMGTVMEVVMITKINSNCGIVNLRMCRHDNMAVEQMKEYLCKQIQTLQPNESSYIHQLGSMLFYMGEYEKSEQMLNMVPIGENSLDDALRPFFVFVAQLGERILVSDDPGPIYRSELPKLSNLYRDLINNPVIPDPLRSIIENAADCLMRYSERFNGNNASSGELDQVLEHFAECLYALGSLALPSTHPIMIQIYIILAGTAANLGKHVQAINYYEKALAACESSLDQSHPNYTFILGNMAISCMEINDDLRAEQLIQQFNSHRSTSDVASIFALRVSALLFRKREDWYAVIACHKDILEMSHLSPNSLDIVQAHTSIGIASIKLGDFDAAFSSLQTALNLQLQHQLLDHPLTTIIRELMLTIEIAKNPYQRMGRTCSCNHPYVGALFASLVNFIMLRTKNNMKEEIYARSLNEFYGCIEELFPDPRFYKIAKIKTIGAAFIAASSVQTDLYDQNPLQSLCDLVEFASVFQSTMQRFNEALLSFAFKLRMSFYFGPVAAGFIETTKLFYDI